MPKETSTRDIQIKEFEAGVQIVTTQFSKTTEVFNSMDEALDAKNVSEYNKKISAAAILMTGFTGIIGSTYLAIESGKDVEKFIVAMGSMLGSYLLVNVGFRVYESGELAANQLHKIKETLGNKKATAENQTPATN